MDIFVSYSVFRQGPCFYLLVMLDLYDSWLYSFYTCIVTVCMSGGVLNRFSESERLEKLSYFCIISYWEMVHVALICSIHIT